MSDYTADSPPPCPKCGGTLTERIGRSMREVVYMYDCDHCDWDDEYARADRLTVATAPWSRDLWAEVERLTAERDAYKRAKAENDERFMIERDEARKERDALRTDLTRVGEWYSAAMKEIGKLTAERDAAAAKERAAVVAWLRLGASWGVLDDYTPDQAADAIEAGDHLDAPRA